MFKRTKLISMVAIAALLGSGIATATAAPDHPKKKTTTTPGVPSGCEIHLETG
jgi:hypothetical protein